MQNAIVHSSEPTGSDGVATFVASLAQGAALRQLISAALIVARQWVLISVVCFYLVAGCCPHPVMPEHKIYTGPTEPMESVIAAINRNSTSVPTLWTQLNYTATFIDEKKNAQTISGDGGLLYASPISLLLTGNKDIAGQVFQLGSNGTEFWVKLRSSQDAYNYWWGHYSNLGKPCCKPIPIRPDMVLHVLGIGTYQSNFLEQPVPVMRFDNDRDVYIFDRNVQTGDHWETQEEIWYDRVTKFPKKVLLYRADGRIEMQADLSDQVPVEVLGSPKTTWPRIARHYDLLVPDNGTRISFDFLEPAVKHEARRNRLIPNAGSFERQEPDTNNKVIQIDAGCNDSSARAE